MKIKIKHFAAAAVMLLILGLVFGMVNSFTGNPVSAFVASRRIQDYAAVNYPALNLELSDVKYNFKNNAYGCYAKSKKREDTNFYIQYSHGKVCDDYEYEVANHFMFLASKKYSKRQKINPAPLFPLFPDSGMCKSVALPTKNQQMAVVN